MGVLWGRGDIRKQRRVKGLCVRVGGVDGAMLDGDGWGGQDHGSQTAVSSWGEERS